MKTAAVHLQSSLLLILIVVGMGLLALSPAVGASRDQEEDRDAKLEELLRQAGFTGRIEQTLETRLGRPIDPKLKDLGRLVFFDKGSEYEWNRKLG